MIDDVAQVAREVTGSGNGHSLRAHLSLLTRCCPPASPPSFPPLPSHPPPSPDRRPSVRCTSWYNWNPSTAGDADTVRALAVARDGALFSGSWDKTIKVWSGTDGTLLHTLRGHTGYVRSLAIAPNGGLLSGCSDEMRVWHREQGWTGRILEQGGSGVSALAVGTDGRVFSNSDNNVHFWI